MPDSITQLRRLPERGRHDRQTIDRILDAGRLAHVGFTRRGRPSVIPTLYARRNDEVLFHGSPASELLRAAKAGADLCLTVTIVDGLVLARSAFHHSANYRSVVVYGKARPIEKDDRRQALEWLVERIVPGRASHLRATTDKEVAATSALALPLDEASAKIRTGPPGDEPEDYELPIWAGVIDVETRFGAVEPDPQNLPSVSVPRHVEVLRW